MALSGTPSPAEPPGPRARSIAVWFTDWETFRTIDLLRLVYAATAVGAFLLTEAGRYIYRRYIYRNEINDFGIADGFGNPGGIVVQIFFSLAILISHKMKAFNVIGFLVAGFVLYEIIRPYLPKGVFDGKDVYGTIIGGFVSVIALVLLRLRVRANRDFCRF